MIISIQYLRAIAALLIVLTHIAFKDQQYSLGNFKFDSGVFGVDIFFVISGFIIYFVSVNKPSGLKGIISFLKHRVIRIIPLYWVLTSFALIVYIIMPENVNQHTGSTDVINSFTLFPSETRYLLAVAWTLSYEFYFYSLFSIALFFTNHRFKTISLILLSLSCLGILMKDTFNGFYFNFLTNDLLLEFSYGVIIAKIFLHVQKNKIMIAFISLGMFLVSMVFYFFELKTGFRGIDFGLPAMFLVLGLIMLEKQLNHVKIKFLETLGTLSYSLYLVHLFVLAFVALIYRKLHINTIASEIFYLVAMFGISLISSYFVYTFIEKPLLALLRKGK